MLHYEHSTWKSIENNGSQEKYLVSTKYWKPTQNKRQGDLELAIADSKPKERNKLFKNQVRCRHRSWYGN